MTTSTSLSTFSSLCQSDYIKFRSLTSSTRYWKLTKNFPEFPMLEKTLFFYNHSESMVRTTVRNIYLSILQSKFSSFQGGNPVYYKYMISYPYCNYFMHYSCFVRDFWLHIDKDYILKDEYMLKASLEDNLDEMMYLHDLLNSNKPELKKVSNV